MSKDRRPPTRQSADQMMISARQRSSGQLSGAASWSDFVVDPSEYRGRVDGGLGLRCRNPIDGPEQELIEAFLVAATTQLRPGRSLTVFAQPAIETGFPDLVAVVWNSKVAETWVAERDRLRAADLRLLHLLATQGAIDLADLEGVFQRGLHGMLTRLEEAAVVTVGRSRCRAKRLSQIFAVERIIAVEAKISANQRVLEQASANTWFSSESYALLPTPEAGPASRDVASSFGVGIISLEDSRVAEVHQASLREVPISYGSWVFNEWTWRISREQRAV